MLDSREISDSDRPIGETFLPTDRVMPNVLMAKIPGVGGTPKQLELLARLSQSGLGSGWIGAVRAFTTTESGVEPYKTVTIRKTRCLDRRPSFSLGDS